MSLGPGSYDTSKSDPNGAIQTINKKAPPAFNSATKRFKDLSDNQSSTAAHDS